MGRATGRPDRTRPASTSGLTPQVEPVAVPTRNEEASTPAPAAAVVPLAPATPAPRTTDLRESGSPGGPKYLTLERKDARLRGDQVEALSTLARRLSARRQERGERITDNTLIRVAVDLLLEHAEQLHGDTEDALRESVTAVLRDSGSPELSATHPDVAR